MNYLFDTNAWLQLGQAPTQIPLRVRKILLAENTIALSPISIIEIAQKQTNGRLTLSAPLEEWVTKALFDEAHPDRSRLRAGLRRWLKAQ